jgi:hypothetical protein
VDLGKDSLSSFFIYLGDRLAGVDVTHFPELLVEINDWTRRFLESLQSLSQCLSIIIFSLDGSCGCANEAPLHEGVFVDVVEENLLALADVLLEVDGLLHCTRETVNQVILRRAGYQTVNQDLNGHLKWDKATISHYLLDLLTILGALKINFK